MGMLRLSHFGDWRYIGRRLCRRLADGSADVPLSMAKATAEFPSELVQH